MPTCNGVHLEGDHIHVDEFLGLVGFWRSNLPASKTEIQVLKPMQILSRMQYTYQSFHRLKQWLIMV